MSAKNCEQPNFNAAGSGTPEVSPPSKLSLFKPNAISKTQDM